MTKQEPKRKRHIPNDTGEGPLDVLFEMAADGCLSGCIGLVIKALFLPIRIVIWIIGSILDN